MAEIQAEPQIDYGALFEHDLDASVIVDREQRVLRVNRSFTRMFGYTADETLSANLDDLVVPADRLDEARTFGARVRAAGELSLATVRKRRDGRLFDVWVVATPHTTADGQQVTFVQYRDVTLQKRAEQSVRASEQQLRAIIDYAPMGIAVVGLNGRIERCNGTFERLLGYGPGELDDQRVAVTIHPEDFQSFRELADAVIGGRPLPPFVDRRCCRKDGSYIWTRERVTLLRSPSGEALRFVTVMEDITDTREAVERREASLELFRSLIAHLRDGIFVADLNWRIAAINQAFFDLLWPGRTIEQTLGMEVHEMIHHCAAQSEDPEGFLWLARKRMAEGAAASDTIRFSGGRVFQRDYVPIRDSQGNVTGHLVDFHDLTEVFRLQEQLRQSQKMEAVGRLAGGIAHDFNNLLTVLQGHAAMLLEDDSLRPGARDDVHEIMKASNKAANLTRQLLAYSRQQVLKPTVLNPGEVVHELQRSLLRMIGKDIRLEVQVAADTPAVRADRTQIEQVIINLAVNARDAMPAGGELNIRTQRLVLEHERPERDFVLPAGTYAVLCVSDSGEGIPHRVLTRIFDPFFTTKEQGKGTGLGLATVYGIVKQSGGYILVHSTEGDGARFEILLPEAPSQYAA